MSMIFSILIAKIPRTRSSFAFLLFSSLSSAAAASPTPHNNLISHFLLNECHFSSSEISKIMKTHERLLRVRSSDTAREAVEFMRHCGFTPTQLHNTILGYPLVLTRKVDRHVKPVFDLLTNLGFDSQNLPIVVAKHPRLLGCSIEKNLSPRIPFLQTLLGSKRNLLKALKRAPELLVHSVEKQLKPKVDFFKQQGIEGEALSLILLIFPSILTRVSIELLQRRMREEYVVNTMGITKGSKTFVYAICVLLKIGPENVEKKLKHLQSLGLFEDEVHELVKKDSWLLSISTKKMQENMEFLTYKSGFQPNIVLTYPTLLHYSVDKRLRPRHAVVRALHAMQKPMPSLPTIFRLTEQKFLQKFVECNPQASKLIEIYQGKVNSTNVETT